MPRYELALIFKKLSQPELINAVKRTSEALVERGAVIRKFENVGLRKLPYTMRKHGVKHKEGNYFSVDFEAINSTLPSLNDLLYQDLDVLRRSILRAEEDVGRPCDHAPCDFGELTDEKRTRLLDNLEKYVKKL